MRVRVLFFGALREIVGRPDDFREIAGPATIEAVFASYAAEFPQLSRHRPSVVFARNREFSPAGASLQDGDEVAFLPPVSGGRGPYTHFVEDPAGHFFALTREPVATREIVGLVAGRCDGAVVVFEGIVRDNTNGRPTRYLEYECYEDMAIQVMARLGREIAGAFPISRIAMVHRLGRMEIGEASVVIVVTSPHRKAAFEAAREGIDRLKRTVPIWKKEFFADGEVWAEGEWDESLRARS